MPEDTAKAVHSPTLRQDAQQIPGDFRNLAPADDIPHHAELLVHGYRGSAEQLDEFRIPVENGIERVQFAENIAEPVRSLLRTQLKERPGVYFFSLVVHRSSFLRRSLCSAHVLEEAVYERLVILRGKFLLNNA